MSEETIERLTQYREEERAIESELSRLEDAIAATKEELKELREEFDDNVQKLRDLVRNGPAQPTLFDQSASIDTTMSPERDGLATPIVELGLPAGIVNALLEAGLSTVGEIAKYTEDGNYLPSIKGIGESKAKKIRDAMAKVWE